MSDVEKINQGFSVKFQSTVMWSIIITVIIIISSSDISSSIVHN